MGDVINLNQYRKRRKREDNRRQTAANVAKYGRSGADRRAEADARDKLERAQDGAKLAPVSVLTSRDQAAQTRREVKPDLEADVEHDESDDSKPA